MVYHQIMPNSELGDHVQEEEPSQLIKAKDAIQFCEKEMSAISS
jgi:nitrate reductase NapD